eukprot:jgi/Galph1/1942/GphlegSOOS_G592.1
MAAEKEETLGRFLDISVQKDVSLKHCLLAITEAAEEISSLLRKGAGLEGLSTSNKFGDQQLRVDVQADQILETKLQKCGVVETICSEENSEERTCGGKGFSVAYDPLDGSSIVDTNFAVGTIFAVVRGNTFIGKSGRDFVAAGCFVYGPRTELSLTISTIDFSHQFVWVSEESEKSLVENRWVKRRTFNSIASGKLFAPGNLRATTDNEGYRELLSFWMDNKYQLRYTGGMVPDVNQLLIKGKGVFCNPASSSAPAKLRLLFECAPLAFLIEKAGGLSSNGEISLLDIVFQGTEERCQVCYGEKGEVERFNKLVGKKFR